MRSRSSSANACGSILISTVVSVTGSVLPRPGSGVVRDVDVHFRGPATDDTVQVALLALGGLLELVAKGYPQIDAVDDDIQHLPLAVAVQRHAVDDGVDIAAAADALGHRDAAHVSGLTIARRHDIDGFVAEVHQAVTVCLDQAGAEHF